MKYFSLLFIFFASCSTNVETTGAFYPGQFRSELNIGNSSTLTTSQNSLISGDSGLITLTAYDTKNQKVTSGGSSVSFSYSGTGTVSISPVVDNGDGTYTAAYQAQKVGTVKLVVTANGKTLSAVSDPITITVGPIDKNSVDIFVTQVDYYVGDQGTITVTPKDTYGNNVNNSGLTVTGTLVNGTATATISAFTYQTDGTYTATVTATGNGTVDTLNIFIQTIGVIVSPYNISVMATNPSYASSTINANSKAVINRPTTYTINIKDSNDAAVNNSLIPVVFKVTGVTGSFTRATYVRTNIYTTTFTPTSVGTATISAKVDGIEIDTPVTTTVGAQ